MKLVWLESARRDLENIKHYHDNEASHSVSARILQKIVHSAKLLIDQPYLGQASVISDDVREWQVTKLPYLLPYRIVDDRIEILRIFHESQQSPTDWKKG